MSISSERSRSRGRSRSIHRSGFRSRNRPGVSKESKSRSPIKNGYDNRSTSSNNRKSRSRSKTISISPRLPDFQKDVLEDKPHIIDIKPIMAPTLPPLYDMVATSDNGNGTTTRQIEVIKYGGVDIYGGNIIHKSESSKLGDCNSTEFTSIPGTFKYGGRNIVIKSVENNKVNTPDNSTAEKSNANVNFDKTISISSNGKKVPTVVDIFDMNSENRNNGIISASKINTSITNVDNSINKHGGITTVNQKYDNLGNIGELVDVCNVSSANYQHNCSIGNGVNQGNGNYPINQSNSGIVNGVNSLKITQTTTTNMTSNTHDIVSGVIPVRGISQNRVRCINNDDYLGGSNGIGSIVGSIQGLTNEGPKVNPPISHTDNDIFNSVSDISMYNGNINICKNLNNNNSFSTHMDSQNIRIPNKEANTQLISCTSNLGNQSNSDSTTMNSDERIGGGIESTIESGGYYKKMGSSKTLGKAISTNNATSNNNIATDMGSVNTSVCKNDIVADKFIPLSYPFVSDRNLSDINDVQQTVESDLNNTIKLSHNNAVKYCNNSNIIGKNCLIKIKSRISDSSDNNINSEINKTVSNGDKINTICSVRKSISKIKNEPSDEISDCKSSNSSENVKYIRRTADKLNVKVDRRSDLHEKNILKISDHIETNGTCTPITLRPLLKLESTTAPEFETHDNDDDESISINNSKLEKSPISSSGSDHKTIPFNKSGLSSKSNKSLSMVNLKKRPRSSSEYSNSSQSSNESSYSITSRSSSSCMSRNSNKTRDSYDSMSSSRSPSPSKRRSKKSKKRKMLKKSKKSSKKKKRNVSELPSPKKNKKHSKKHTKRKRIRSTITTEIEKNNGKNRGSIKRKLKKRYRDIGPKSKKQKPNSTINNLTSSINKTNQKDTSPKKRNESISDIEHHS